MSFYLGQKLTYDNVLEVLGAVDTDVFSRLLRSVIRRDVPKVLDIVDDLVMQGRELTQLATDFTWYLRNLLLVKTSDNIEDVLDVSTENMQQLQEEAGMVEADMLLRYIRIFFGIVRSAEICKRKKRVFLEVALIKLCTPAMETSSDSILDRIRVLEEKLEQGVISGGQERVVYVKEDGQAPAEPTPRPELPNAVPEDVQQVVKNFRPIADEASGMLRTYLKKARLSLAGDNRLMIVMPDALGADLWQRR
mgnify:CR=1 FL=1